LSPAGFPAGKGAGGSAAQAVDKSSADETTNGEMADNSFMKLSPYPFGKSKEAETVPRQSFPLPRIKVTTSGSQSVDSINE